MQSLSDDDVRKRHLAYPISP